MSKPISAVTDEHGNHVFKNKDNEVIEFPAEFSSELIDDVMGNVVMCDECGMFYPEWYSDWHETYREQDTGYAEFACQRCYDKDMNGEE